MKRTDELLKLDICCITQIYAKYFLIMVVLVSVLLFATPVSAITVDGIKSADEWNDSWAYGQTQGTGYDANGPFGDRLVIRQGGFSIVGSDWNDLDPKDDAGASFDTSMARAGSFDSGSDIKSVYMHFNTSTGILYGLCEVYGIPGDLDGDGSVSTNSTYGDTGGNSGPAGDGIGRSETWKIRASQDGEFVDIKISNNDWTVTSETMAIGYDDVVAKFASINNGCYEIEIHNITSFFDISLDASPIMIEALAGANDDGIGEDMATAFVHVPLSATIGDYVWSDTNNDGVQNGSESGISGVLVDLVLDGTIISTNTTDGTGLYMFDNLVADCYDVVINSSNFESGGALESHIASPANMGGDDAIDSDGIDNSSSVCVNPGDVNLTIDFGYVPLPATIGDYVWSDTNNNGIQDDGDSGIFGVLVDLVLDSTIISTNTTDGTGLYLFDNLVADCYDVVINSSNFESGGALKGHIASPANMGGDDTIDSDGIDNSSSVCVDHGDVNLTIDFGYVPLPAMIGDYVWSDTNNDGIQNVSEVGIDGVVVDLMNGSMLIATDTTNSTGYYLFDNLVADCYDVVINSSNFEFGGALKGHIASPANMGSDDTIDSDGIDNSSIVCVDPGDVNLTIDFGYVPLPATIGDYVWSDTNNNGTQDSGELGIEGVVVDLMNGSTIVSTNTTDADGLYLFDNLVADCYDVVINSSNFESGGALKGHIASPANIGTDDTIDSDGIDNSSSVCVDPGDVNFTIDFGYVPLPATIGDYVWEDTNNNGVQNVSEFGIFGVLIDLVLDGTIISNDTTDCNGLYLFENLVADCYDVVINSSNFESGGVLEGRIASIADAGTDDANDSDGINNASSVCVDPGDVNLTIDFGYYEPCISDNVTIGDYVWADINQNGIQNNDCEPGIPCVVVDLVQGNTIIATTLTDKCGFYMFNVTVGCYSGVECYDVVINSSNFDSGGILFGHTASPYNVGINDEIDSDGINNIASLCVFAGDENPTIDFGYYNSGDFDYIYDSDTCPDCNGDG